MNFLSSRRNLGFKWTQKRMGWVVPEVPENLGYEDELLKTFRLVRLNLDQIIVFPPQQSAFLVHQSSILAAH